MYIYYAGFFFFIWLVILTIVVYKSRSHYYKLAQRTRKNTIDDVLDSLIDKENELKKDIDEVRKIIDNVLEDSRGYFQKLSLVRFSPFGKPGNDQSFVIALLDKDDRGIVMNFIYTPEGIRVYTKKIKDKKGEEYELSGEELKAIKLAVNS